MPYQLRFLLNHKIKKTKVAFYFSFVTLIILSGCSSHHNPHINSVEYLDKAVLLAHVKELSSAQYLGRETGSKENLLSSQYIKHQLIQTGAKTLPLVEGYTQPFTYSRSFNEKQGQNIVGYFVGNEEPEKYIVISAHFDHIGSKGNTIYYGADDNASGVAAALAIARTLAHTNHRYSYIFLFSDAEEVNLNGAKAFLTLDETLTNNIILNINLDMIAGSDKSKSLNFLGYRLRSLLTDDALAGFYQEQKQYPLAIKKGFKSGYYGALKPNFYWQLASDHGAFYRKKIPFAYYGVGLHKNYHKSSDTYQNLNKTNLVNASNAIFDQLLYLDKHIKKM